MTKPHTTRRINRARKIAYLADIQRIYYAANFSAFCHSWALILLKSLLPSAYTVLLFLAALHRAGRMGYAGCAVAQSLLAPQIALATGRACSERTLQRGIAQLRVFGFLTVRKWAIPDMVMTMPSGRTVTLKGTARVETDDGKWRTLQIGILLITEKAAAMWDPKTGGDGARYLDVGPLPTPAKVADSSQNDLVSKPTKIDPQPNDRSTSTDPRQIDVRQRIKDKRASKESPSNEQGTPTRPATSRADSPQTLEHGALTIPSSMPPGVESSGDTQKALEQSLTVSNQDPCHKPTRGCTASRPQIPRGAQCRNTWSVGCQFILNELHKALVKYSTREADSIFALARNELNRNTGYPGWPRTTNIDWAYWVHRFQDFQPMQRRFFVFRDILPQLKTNRIVTPNEPSRYREGVVAHAAPLDPRLEEYKKLPKPKENPKISEHISHAMPKWLKMPAKYRDDDEK